MNGRAPPELPAGIELVSLELAASARSEAARRARTGAPEGTLVWVRQPQRPMARANRAWQLAATPGLHAALVLRPGLPADECAQLGPLAVLAIGRALAERVEPMTDLRYRWPNDVLLDRGKVAGVWLEADGSPECVDWLVVSWAANVEAAPADLGFDAASLQSEGASGPVEPAGLLQSVVRELASAIVTWDEDGFESLRSSWERRLLLGEPIHLALEDGSHVAGIAEAVDANGALSVRAGETLHRVGLGRFFALPESGDDR
ncbi:MAG: biotin/lipoate--protein ligase family protein [Halofilum sp. (in: g-proteobacteria)]|nr:biotin/lipoate--protein ligase family protein [Halofilum sp. (in: g-proteobacteria)]